MGLLSRLKADRAETATTSFSVRHDQAGRLTKPPSHARTHTSSSSLTGSDFLTAASDSSYTSAESHLGFHKAAAMDHRTDGTATPPRSRPQSAYVHAYKHSLSSIATPTPQKHHSSVPTTPYKSIKDDEVTILQDTTEETPETDSESPIGPVLAELEAEKPPAPVSTALAVPASHSAVPVANVAAPRGQMAPQQPAPSSSEDPLSFYPYYSFYNDQQTELNSGSSDFDSSGSDSDTDAGSEAATTAANQHPYYDQWRQYYAQLAMIQQQQQQQMMAANRQSMYGGFPPQMNQYYQMNMMNPMQMQMMQYYQQQMMQNMRPQQPQLSRPASQMFQQPQLSRPASQMFQQPQLSRPASQMFQPYMQQNPSHASIVPSGPGAADSNAYLSSYKGNNVENELLLSSRRSTVKSNRYPSVPLATLQRNGSVASHRNRISSLDLNFKPKEFRSYQEEEDDQVEFDAPRQMASSRTGSVAYNLSELDLEDKTSTRYISDYSKYLFEEDEGDDQPKQLPTPSTGASLKDEAKQLPTPSSTEESLHRQESSASTGSYNSIQSNASSKFIVGSKADREAKIAQPQPKKKGKKKEGSHSPKNRRKSPELTFMADSMNQTPMMSPMMPPMNGSVDNLMLSPPFGNPMMNFSTEYNGGSPGPCGSRRQSLMLDSKRQSTMMPFDNPHMRSPPMNRSMGFGVQSNVPKGNEAVNDKIRQFIVLRKIIASGKKSVDFRLKWVKMLILATNYKLYAYINIKGEAIDPEQAAQNKSFFVKSSITHLMKLIREYESGKGRDDAVKLEVYYIYGCLLKHDYNTAYNQDFGIAKNIDNAIAYFEKCLDIDPNDSKALYKLGDIYEYEFADRFEDALSFYKQSAKRGYNRAIYKVSLLYLNVASIRSLRFFKYLHDLSNIESKDIEFTEEDREELEEVIGLASYQLGKIYEGIYPGDLSAEDEFIQQALEMAPVKYAKSLTYYNKAAKLNCLLAQVKLGQVYEFGELNRPSNASKSIQWYLKAATSPLSFKRHPDAMLGLSRWSMKGSNGESKHIPTVSPEKAVMWCDRAIKEFNSPDAYYLMGELAQMGFSHTNPDMWFVKAQELGHQGPQRE